ncbi:hypothetical protein TRVL_04793 [Trypanosoma vivax]|nr:hypothetical protein TRVL_04793 [Trypanosoma vivax]
MALKQTVELIMDSSAALVASFAFCSDWFLWVMASLTAAIDLLIIVSSSLVPEETSDARSSSYFMASFSALLRMSRARSITSDTFLFAASALNEGWFTTFSQPQITSCVLHFGSVVRGQ